MGKKGAKTGKYEHIHTYNPKARESKERKLQSIQSLEVKRHQMKVDKILQEMRSYIPPEERVKPKIDPLYQLKGAARAALEHYRPPGYKEPTPPVDLMSTHRGRMWEHPLGRELLETMMSLGIAMHAHAHKTKGAINTFLEMLELDTQDHLLVRHKLLRCYLDLGWADEARRLLEKHAHDESACFAYTRALIEHISIILGESGSSVRLRDSLLMRAIAANPYAIWPMAFSKVFTELAQDLDRIPPLEVQPGTVEDALAFFDVDFPLWADTEGVLDWIDDFIDRHKEELWTMPEIASILAEQVGDGDDEDDNSAIADSDAADDDDDEIPELTAVSGGSNSNSNKRSSRHEDERSPKRKKHEANDTSTCSTGVVAKSVSFKSNDSVVNTVGDSAVAKEDMPTADNELFKEKNDEEGTDEELRIALHHACVDIFQSAMNVIREEYWDEGSDEEDNEEDNEDENDDENNSADEDGGEVSDYEDSDGQVENDSESESDEDGEDHSSSEEDD